jgi:hypothetical protein
MGKQREHETKKVDGRTSPPSLVIFLLYAPSPLQRPLASQDGSSSLARIAPQDPTPANIATFRLIGRTLKGLRIK